MEVEYFSCREVDVIYFRNYPFSPVFELERKSGKYLCAFSFSFCLVGKLTLKTLVRGNFLFIVLAFPLLKPYIFFHSVK